MTNLAALLLHGQGINLDVFAHFSMGVATSILGCASLAGALRILSVHRADAIMAWTTLTAGFFYLYILSAFNFLWFFQDWNLVAPENQQHFVIDAVWIAIGACAVWRKSAHEESVILRCIAMFLIAVLLYFHVHNFSHAVWLQPYHRAMSDLLALGIYCYLASLYFKKRLPAVVASLTLCAVGMMLMLYQAPGNASSCEWMIMDGQPMLMC